VVLVEADPAGADLGGRFGAPDHPGLSSLVVAARRDCGPEVWRAHIQTLELGVDVVIGPAAGRQAFAAVAGLADHLPPADVDLILDVGRVSETSPAWKLVASSDALLVVTAADIVSLDHTAAVTAQHAEHPNVLAVLVGKSQFGFAEMVDVLGVPVLVSVPTDRRTATVLTGMTHPGRGWTRFGIPAAARTAALQLVPQTAAAATGSTPVPRRGIPLLTKGGAR
jgi:hypothetical protein